LQASWTATGREARRNPNSRLQPKRRSKEAPQCELSNWEGWRQNLTRDENIFDATTNANINNNKNTWAQQQQKHNIQFSAPQGGKGTYILAPKFNKYFRKQIFDKNGNSINSLATSLPHYSEQKTKKQKQKKEKIPRTTSVQDLTPQSLESPLHIKTQDPQNREHMHTDKQSKTKQASKQAQTPYLLLQNNFPTKEELLLLLLCFYNSQCTNANEKL
jgi:hypothetical protein